MSDRHAALPARPPGYLAGLILGVLIGVPVGVLALLGFDGTLLSAGPGAATAFDRGLVHGTVGAIIVGATWAGIWLVAS